MRIYLFSLKYILLTALFGRVNKNMQGTREMAQLGKKALAAEPEDLNLIPWPHTVEGENRIPQAVL